MAERLGRDARSGALFVFFGKRREAMKVLFFDGTGGCLFYKRLDKGTFRIPPATTEGAAMVEVAERALDDLLGAIAWRCPTEWPPRLPYACASDRATDSRRVGRTVVKESYRGR